MFTKKNSETTDLQNAIDALFAEMSKTDPKSDEYSIMVTNMSTLYKLKEVDSTQRVSAETVATIVANLAGIALILGHERANVVASKAVSFVMKLR